MTPDPNDEQQNKNTQPQETDDAEANDEKADNMIEETRERTGHDKDIAGGSPGQSPKPQKPTSDSQ